jgi:hypothetical protein
MYALNLSVRLILSVTLIAFLNACDKPGDDTPDNKEYVVKEIVYDAKYTADYFEYNSAWQLIQTRHTYFLPRNSKGTFESNYVFNSAGLVTRIETAHYMPLLSYEGIKDLSYNSDGRLVAVSEHRKNTAPILDLDEYEYNGNTISQKHYMNSVLDYTCTYTLDDNGNIIKAVTDGVTSSSLDYVEEWLDYDDKQNLLGPGAGDVVSKNNYRRYVRQIKNHTSADEAVIQYTYKNDKYVDGFTRTGSGVYSGTSKAKVTWVAKE